MAKTKNFFKSPVQKKYAVSGLLMGAFLVIIFQVLFITLQSAFPATTSLAAIHKHPAVYFLYLLPAVFFYIGHVMGGKCTTVSDSVQNLSAKIFKFVESLTKEEYHNNYELSGDKDELGKALINLRDVMKKNKEEEASRRIREQQHNWATEGFAKFGELLRISGKDFEEFAFRITRELVKYTKSNQGAFFSLKEENSERFFEMTSCYAYERKKFADRKIPWGDGIIGECAYEKEYVYITEVPDNYLNITSGLGDANPRNILLVPLVFNNEVFGVIELASFKLYQQFEIDFVNNLAESIASSISTLKTNLLTSELLRLSEEKTQQLLERDEEMRQNIEMLETVKEQLSQKMEDLENAKNKISSEIEKSKAVLEGCIDGVITFNNTGTIEFMNKSTENIWGIRREQFIGKNIKSFMPVEITGHNGDRYVFYCNGERKMIGVRTEVEILKGNNEKTSVLMSLSNAKTGNDFTHTLFVQNIEVELF